MRITEYKPEKHAEYLPDHQVPKYSEGDIDRFRSVAEEAVNELKEFVDFDDDLELVLGVTDTEKLDEDAPTGYYFMGYSFDEGMRGYSRNAVFMRASDEPEEWRAAMKGMLIHELGHQVFYQTDVDWEDDQYHSVMFEGHAENLAKLVGDRNGRDFSPVWRKEEPVEVDKEDLYKDLEKPRSTEEEKLSQNMFRPSGDRWQDAEGYTIAFQIVRRLIEEEETSINSMLETSSKEWREMVEKTVKELY